MKFQGYIYAITMIHYSFSRVFVYIFS